MEQINEEIKISDGQTEQIPPLAESLPEVSPADLQAGCPMTATSDTYTREEFSAVFNDFLTFLKSPDTSIDTFEAIRSQGQELAAGKIYEMADKYSFLHWIIDRRTAFLHDMALISVFIGCETQAIVYNWTNISLKEKITTWLKSKFKQRIQAAQQQPKSAKRFGWGFLGRRDPERPQKPESLPENSAE